jgi:hypothetical protein
MKFKTYLNKLTYEQNQMQLLVIKPNNNIVTSLSVKSWKSLKHMHGYVVLDISNNLVRLDYSKEQKKYNDFINNL